MTTRLLPALLLAAALLQQAIAAPVELPGSNGSGYTIDRTAEALEIAVSGMDLNKAGQTFFVALGTGSGGSIIVPYEQKLEGSTVFLPFKANLIVFTQAGAQGSRTFVRQWNRTQWGPRQPAGDDVKVVRTAESLTISLANTLVGDSDRIELAAWRKNMEPDGGWGLFFASTDPHGPRGMGEIINRRFVAITGTGDSLEASLVSPRGRDLSKIRIYQMLPRLFGNTNETRKENGFLEDNGVGKFADLDGKAIEELKKLGATHIWLTGVFQQATSTDYQEIGEPADDPDLLKGLAGSPYAIRDYFDVSPDYAVDPSKRLEEFKQTVDRLHDAGLKVLIDFVPNHVARSYSSTVRPELTFGATDNRSVFFSPENNFFWLEPGKDGPPLRLPTVDQQGNIISPTSKVAKTPSDGLFKPELEHGRVTGDNVASWMPGQGNWYETVKLNYGFDFTDKSKATREYPHGDHPDKPIPDTWEKMDSIVAYWQDLGVDGFRVDMAHMVPPEFWHWMIARARERNPEVFFVAEAYDTDPAKVPGGDPLIASIGGGNIMFDLLAAGFDATYDDATYDTIKEIYDEDRWANDIDAMAERELIFDNSLRYAENHDEVRLSAPKQWGGVGMQVGRPVSAILFGLSRGPVMLYHGQEVGEPALGREGFGGDDSRTTIFDYWSMPEFTKWVNDKKFDGGRLSDDQKDLRAFYSRLLALVDEPAFRNGDYIALNPANIENEAYGRLPGETSSGHWLYSFVRHDTASGQTFLVVVNLNPTETMRDVRIIFPDRALAEFASHAEDQNTRLAFTDQLASANPARYEESLRNLEKNGLSIPEIPPLTPLYLKGGRADAQPHDHQE
jgi:glycosidase